MIEFVFLRVAVVFPTFLRPPVPIPPPVSPPEHLWRELHQRRREMAREAVAELGPNEVPSYQAEELTVSADILNAQK